ncbi:MAG: OmpA family protein [Thermodesulfobacteriota bacterium]|nr:OmpA family protein [Thermodesulfobacteriota bacterium]
MAYIKAQERKHEDFEGEVYLGHVMTINYPLNSVETDNRYSPFLLELTDVLKTPMRRNYRIVLKGFSDKTGPADLNRNISLKRGEILKRILINQFYMKGERITIQGFGSSHPVASNETPEGRYRNRRVEIHLYGTVFDTDHLSDKEEEAK